ncbi:hypothetical protein P7F88_25290 [Vibrio hannami]|uniref:hypothetical protein n=1 Tax=Vibrio hannami TaxID=2717094 RepID=UPI002410744F|nr:hypothetical protein [Vibrio hannami]MDG3089180.1 hypothetical protein [Vibrio hannami]
MAALVEQHPLQGDDDDSDKAEEARQAIHDDPLSLRGALGLGQPWLEKRDCRVRDTAGWACCAYPIGSIDSYGMRDNVQRVQGGRPWTFFPASYRRGRGAEPLL